MATKKTIAFSILAVPPDESAIQLAENILKMNSAEASAEGYSVKIILHPSVKSDISRLHELISERNLEDEVLLNPNQCYTRHAYISAAIVSQLSFALKLEGILCLVVLPANCLQFRAGLVRDLIECFSTKGIDATVPKFLRPESGDAAYEINRNAWVFYRCLFGINSRSLIKARHEGMVLGEAAIKYLSQLHVPSNRLIVSLSHMLQFITRRKVTYVPWACEEFLFPTLLMSSGLLVREQLPGHQVCCLVENRNSPIVTLDEVSSRYSIEREASYCLKWVSMDPESPVRKQSTRIAAPAQRAP